MRLFPEAVRKRGICGIKLHRFFLVKEEISHEDMACKETFTDVDELPLLTNNLALSFDYMFLYTEAR